MREFAMDAAAIYGNCELPLCEVCGKRESAGTAHTLYRGLAIQFEMCRGCRERFWFSKPEIENLVNKTGRNQLQLFASEV